MVDPAKHARGVDAGLLDERRAPLGRGALLEQRADRRDVGCPQLLRERRPDALDLLDVAVALGRVGDGRVGNDLGAAASAALRSCLVGGGLRGEVLRRDLARPASMPSAIARTISEHERIASSLPGITKSASSGSQFVSTSAITGRCEPLRLAHGELLLLQVDDEDRVGLALHVGDAAEVRLELLELVSAS